MKAHLGTLDGISANLTAEYEQRDGEDGYFLKVEPVNGLELGDFGAMRSALQSERGNRKNLEKFGDITPDQAQKAIARAAELEEKIAAGALTKADEIESRDRKSSELFDQAEAKWNAERSSLEGTLDLEIREKEALRLLREGGYETAAELMLPKLLPSLRLVRDSEGRLTRTLEVVDTNGVRMVGTRPGSDMTPQEAVTALHATYGKWADGSGNSGGGGGPQDGTDKPMHSGAVRQIGSIETNDDLAALAAGTAVRTI